jgi:pantoate--beta-alanine ligase
MQITETINVLRAQVNAWRLAKQTIAFVPTMGNLHEGHLSLVNKAKELADKVVVSIFVNPMQFDDQNDLSAYPRTVDEDVQLLTPIGCDVLFLPSADKMYPEGMQAQTVVSVPGSDDKLCGLARKGHFDGVATIVTKLFNIVQADVAVFGEKDYQQLLVIKKLAKDLSIPVEVIGASTLREPSGLALSSRNQYLTEDERVNASNLYLVLTQIKDKIEQGERDYFSLQQQGKAQLSSFGFAPDYLDIRNADNLNLAQPDDSALRILVAARLGKARLIDNVACNLA